MKKTAGSKRPSLDSVMSQAAALKRQAAEPETVAAAVPTDKGRYVPNAVSLPESYWKLLRDVADARADRGQPGRRSSSKVIAELIEAHWDELQAELK